MKQNNKLHNRLALLMQEVHLLCVNNGINYTLLGGSLIGAMRHQGFIPWDDDIDIGMPWDDYKKFRKLVFEDFKHPWLRFDLANYCDDYYNPFIKAIDSRTTLIEEYYRDNPKGIFIDIFPIVYAGNTKEEAMREFKRHRLLQSILKRKKYRFKTGFFREIMMITAGAIVSKKLCLQLIERHYEHCCKTWKEYSSDMDGNEKGIVPSRLFDSFLLYKFENFEFMGLKDADEYLRLVFGDYMELPPEDQRKPHHIEYLNLDMPYEEYAKHK